MRTLLRTLLICGGGGLTLVAYCDASRQTWVVVTNSAPTPYVVEWTPTAVKPGYPPDRWSSVSDVEPGQFEGWMSPAPYLHLDISYDDDGVPTTIFVVGAIASSSSTMRILTSPLRFVSAA